MTQIAAFSILALTLTLALRRPRVLNVRVTHAHAAIAGALAIVGLNIVPAPLALRQVQQLVFPFITIVSLMTITVITERTGMFDDLARGIARAARGRPSTLFTLLYVTGAAVGALFTNDAAVLVFTPLVLRLTDEIEEPGWSARDKLPYFFAVLYVANVVGVLVISNPINIIVCDLFDISFLEYARWLVLPALVSIVASYAGLRVVFRHAMPESFRVPEPVPIKRQRRGQMAVCGLVLAATLAGFFLQQWIGVETWVVAASSAVCLLLFHTLSTRSSPVPVVRAVGWDVLIFVAGMFIIATGVRNIGVTEQLASLIHGAGNGDIHQITYTTALTACVASALMNNHPTAVTMSMVINDMDLSALDAKLAAFAALIGGDLGPKMLPTGSLAAMLWFRILRSRGVEVSYMTYVKIGIPITLGALLLAVAALNLEIRLAGSP